MKCGIRWKVFGLLVLMAVSLPAYLYFAAKSEVEMYAADRELVDAINDAQCAANRIQNQLDDVEDELRKLANEIRRSPERLDGVQNVGGDLTQLNDPKLRELVERDYGKSPNHQPGKAYLQLHALRLEDIPDRISMLQPRPEVDLKSIRETASSEDELCWLGPYATSEPNRPVCYVVVGLQLPDAESHQCDCLLAKVDLTPLFENERHARAFVTILDSKGDPVFRPTSGPSESNADASVWRQLWTEFVKEDESKAERLLGEKFGWSEEAPEDALALQDITGERVEQSCYRQLKIAFDDQDVARGFKEFMVNVRNRYRNGDMGIKRAEWLRMDETQGELRIRANSPEQVDAIQRDVFAGWRAHAASEDFPEAAEIMPKKREIDYQADMGRFAVCMVGMSYPSRRLADGGNDSRSDEAKESGPDGAQESGPDFTLAMATSVTEIQKAATSHLKRPALFLGLMTSVFCLLGLVYAWHVTEPLMAMTHAAQHLTKRVSGDTDDGSDTLTEEEVPSLPESRKDEVGALARAFSELSKQVIASNNELNARVEHRTEQLAASKQKLEQYVTTLQQTSRELQEQRDRAELADKAKSGFLATVSHEMKTPLHHLKGYAKRLRRGSLDDRQELCVDRIFEAIDKLNHLIGDVLDYQKILLGGMSIELETVNPFEACERIIETMNGRAEERGNRLTLDYRCDIAEFVTDPRRLEQVLSNLLTNACKFTDAGEICLSVSSEDAIDDQPEILCFEVKDTGVGIPPEHLRSLFTPFEKRKAKQGNNDGTGLGLVICRELSRLLGGDVSVTSEVGVGTSFVVRLPADLSLDAEAGEEKQPSQFDTDRIFGGTDSDVQGLTVLIVDDDPRSTELLAEELEAAHCRVVTASSGEVGLDRARLINPDLIMLDIVMPGMDGWEVLERLKSDTKTKDIPVILVSIIGDSRKGLMLGADGYLTKPFAPRELRRVLQQVLGWNDGSVLVVDDDANSRELVREWLGPTGYTITEAAHGEEALEQIIDQPPDAILLDLVMPKMDGFELIEQLRSRDLLSKSKIIVVSGRELSQQDRDGLSDSVVSFLDKAALEEQQLKLEIRKLLKKSMSATART